METAAPDGFCVDPTPKSVYVDVSEGDREYTVAAINYEKPDMKITKTDAQTGAPIPGTVLSIKSVTAAIPPPSRPGRTVPQRSWPFLPVSMLCVRNLCRNPIS